MVGWPWRSFLPKYWPAWVGLGLLRFLARLRYPTLLRIGAALGDFPSDDAVADTLRHHRLIEAEARRIPVQYLWLHKRFKGLSADYPDPYA